MKGIKLVWVRRSVFKEWEGWGFNTKSPNFFTYVFSCVESHNDRLVDENEKLKRMLSDLEDERLEYKRKIKEVRVVWKKSIPLRHFWFFLYNLLIFYFLSQLTEEMFSMQKRLQEAAASAEGSDKDSSDPLSELDKQETLLRNINTKNKHIKRLLREIEVSFSYI